MSTESGKKELRHRGNVREIMSNRVNRMILKCYGHVNHVNKKHVTWRVYKSYGMWRVERIGADIA